MSHFVHARNTPEGIRFRLWTDNSDQYYIREMTEAELRTFLLKEVLCDASAEFMRTIEERVQRTVRHGTSSMMGDTRDLNGPWDKSRDELDAEVNPSA